MRFPSIHEEAVCVYLKIKDVSSIFIPLTPPTFFSFLFFPFQDYFLEAGKCLLFLKSVEIMMSPYAFACEVSQRILPLLRYISF